MPQEAEHLSKSRHGVWYYRWLVPERVRVQHPQLPRELKRSTRTSDIRQARVIARRLHRTLAAQILDLDMDAPWPNLAGIRKFEVHLDPFTGRVCSVKAEPHEMEAAIATAQRLQEHAQANDVMTPERMEAYIKRRVAEMAAESKVAAQADHPAPPPAVLATAPPAGQPAVPATPTISEAFADWAEGQVQAKEWTNETLVHAHEPTNRIFRELIGEPVKQPAGIGGDSAPAIDLELSRLTPERMARFIKEFHRYPKRQGKRPAGATARDVLEGGGPSQALANTYKRLRQVSQFIEHCVAKSWVDAQVLKELQIVLAKDTARARAKLRAAQDPDGTRDDDGYVSFTDKEVARIFGDGFMSHVTGTHRRSAATYWLPLIGLFSAMRCAEMSALEVDDFQVIENVHCVRVRTHTALSANSKSNRMKTVASRRTVPLHPKLIELGLLSYVRQRREGGHRHLWDGLPWEDKSGYGRYPSSDFRRLAQAVGVYEERRKVLHSFRATLSQALERVGMAPEHIDRFLGHDVKNTRAVAYSRTSTGVAVPIALMYEQLCRVSFPVDVPVWT